MEKSLESPLKRINRVMKYLELRGNTVGFN